MSPLPSAIVLGASGSVGNALIYELISSGGFNTIVSLTRRSQPVQLTAARGANASLREVLIPTMSPDHVEQAARDAALSLEGTVVGLSVLGIGAGTAKLTIDQHRAVDVALNKAFARGLALSGRVPHLAFMSAVGANANSSPNGSGAAGSSRYNRVKGEAEAAVLTSGVPVVSTFRPSMIIGSQHTPWLLEKLLPVFSVVTPSKFKSITVQQIAKAMVATSRNVPTVSAIYHHAEMMDLGRSA